jgi:fructosamine-3-kinase
MLSIDVSAKTKIGHVRAVPLLLHSFEPEPEAVILHGDLWSGNAGFDSTTSSAVIYDPASYWGHNEADLGIIHMFGGKIIHLSSSSHVEEARLLARLL